MARKRKQKNAEERELTPTEQLSQLQSSSLCKRFVGAVIYSILMFVLYVWQFQPYELQWWRMVYLICVNVIVSMLDAYTCAYGGFVNGHRGGEDAEDSIHFYESGKARSGGLAGLLFGNVFGIALLILLPEWLLWHNHRPFFVVTRAFLLNKQLFLVLFVSIWILSQLISYFTQRIFLCKGRIKLLRQDAGLD